jgi:hypothetical protein
MKRTLAFAALLFLAAADPRQPLIGHWVGTSICTGVRPACHDETASYWVKAGKKPDIVTIDAGKIVDGKDVLMGTLDFQVDVATRTLTSVSESGGSRVTWTFTWSGTTMTGTAKSSDGQVFRNIRLTKKE